MTSAPIAAEGIAIVSADDRPAVRFKSVSVRYESGPPWARQHFDAVRAVDLDIATGQTLGLVGESGSGKTTLGRLALGILRPTEGAVLIDGVPLENQRRRLRGKSQGVFQNPEWSLNPRLRVSASVAEPLVILRMGDRRQQRERVHQMLEQVGLEPALAMRYPHQLSGGQLQRIAIARALITEPTFIVFDEAVSALDVSVQAQILNLIRTTQAERQFASLFISHDLAAVRYVSKTIAVMYAGEIIELAAGSRFYGRPRHPYGRALQLSIMEASEVFQPTAGSGEVASTGCPYRLRCPMAVRQCEIEKPKLRLVDDELVACHRAEEVGPL